MHTALASPRPLPSWPNLTRILAGFLVFLLLAWSGAPAQAAPPPAGTSISNQASATYSDGSGVARTVTSNLVQTTVTQVYSLTLTQNGAQNATPGSVVYYPHTLTNTGNGTDTFTLSAANGTGFTMGSIQIFADNGSGQPTGSAITSSGAIASGATFRFIVQGTVPVTATSGATNVLNVTATSVGGGSVTPVTASNQDTTTVTSNAVVTLTKAISASSGAPGSGPYTYTLTYTNTGNSNATAVAITDAIPAGMSYVTGSARWSVTGGTPAGTALSESGGASGSGPNTLTSTVTGGPTGPFNFAATIATVTPGQSGFLSFQVNVNASVAPGVLNNTANVSYNNGAATVTGSSNVVPFTVSQTAGVTLDGATVAGPVAAGSTVSFTNVLVNTGTGTDTFNVSFAPTNTFPIGTTFQLFRSDGVTPMVDTNGDGTEDTGPLAAGATYNVIVRATLPPNANGGPFSITKIARSVLNSSVSDDAVDTVTAVAGAQVDLTNDSGTGPGVGIGPEGSAVVTNTTNPGTTTVFTLVASNKGPSPDTYNLSASTDSNFGAGVPTGWTVSFRADGGAGNCSTTGATITNTGTVAATTGTATVCAIVTIPAGYDAGTTSLYFRAMSPTSGVFDRLHDAVTVNAVRSISLTPNGTGQTYPGGSYVYTHTLTNNGNVAEGSASSTLTPALANDISGWTATLYIDSNNNGVLDASDVLVTGTLNAVLTSGVLAKGQSVTLFNRVIAPSGAVAGAVNATTITVTTANGSYTTTVPAPAVATDSTTVIAGNLTLVKVQALDAACDGTADGAYSQANLNARPGECVLYRITVTNVGAADATNVVVSDATPSYTTISTVPATTNGAMASPNLTVGAAGTVTAYIGTGSAPGTGGVLGAGETAVISFGVRITP